MTQNEMTHTPYTMAQAWQLVWDTEMAQKKRAYNEIGRCQCRTWEGHRCYIGALIPDEIYSKEMEGQLVQDDTAGLSDGCPTLARLWSRLDLGILSLLMGIHDDKDLDHEGRLARLIKIRPRFVEDDAKA